MKTLPTFRWIFLTVLAALLIPGSASGNVPCLYAWTDYGCANDGSVTLVTPTNSPVICIGDSMTVLADTIFSNCTTRTTTYYFNCDPDVVDADGGAPSYGVTWTASVGTSWSTNGTGLKAEFQPTNCCGPGYVSFSLLYTNNSPCTRKGPSGAGVSFTVSCACLVSSIVTNNQEAKVIFTNVTVTPTNLCYGNSLNVTASRRTTNAIIKITTSYTNACGAVVTNYCPTATVTNKPLPTILTNWWTVAGPGTYTKTGSGLTTGSFQPTNGPGTGTVTFYTQWRHAIDTNTEISTTNVVFVLTTNCLVASIVTSCPVNGSGALTNVTMSPANGCLGNSFNATASQLIQNGMVLVKTSYTNSCGETTTNCPENTVTNYVAPTVSTSWAIVGPGSYANSGSGLSTGLFKPTSCGNGTVFFYLTYQNNTPCDTNSHLVTASVGFSVSCACILAGSTNNCLTSGSISLGSATTNPIIGCLGNTFSASVTQAVANAIVVYKTQYTNACGQVTTNCPDSFVTNRPPPTVVSNWWVATAGSWSTNGQGSAATFVPPGSGTVTFNLTYKNNTPCDTNVYSATPVNVAFNIQSGSLALSRRTVFVNVDDDNQNGTNDVSEPLTGSGSEVAGENDLVQLDLALQNVSGSQVVTLSVSGSTGKIRVWPKSTRGPGAPLLDNSDPSKLTTNWLASAAPTTVYVEGVSASASVDDVALNLSIDTGCTSSTNLTVIGLGSVSFQTNLSALFGNPGLGGGLAIYPDKPTPGSTGDYSAVKVVATITPAMPGITLFLKAFDVDDPSSTSAPLDDEAASQDNKALANKAGQLGGGGDTITLVTDTNGVAKTDFNVTLQPGDNFRVVASPLADFQNHCAALQANDHGALVYLNSTNEIPPNYQNYVTPMLTVWRRLHVEVDSMSAVTNNQVTGFVTKMLGNSSGVTNVFLSKNLKTGLTLPDNSTNLSSPSPENGRFENGWMAIGNNTNNVLGNGDDFVQMSGGTVKFNLKYANGSNGVAGQVINMVFIANLNSYQFTVNRTLVGSAYNGGTLTVAGTAFNVIFNNTTQVQTGPGNLPFTLHDDDNDTLLPQSPDVSGMAVKWQAAYIVPLFDTGFDSTNDTFHLNSNRGSDNPGTSASHWREGRGSPFSSTDYWVIMVKNGYQTSPYDGAGGETLQGVGDNDPNNEGTWRAAAVSLHQSVLLLEESIRDWIVSPASGANGGGDGIDPDASGASGRQIRRQEILNHEVGHLFGLDHPDGEPVAAGSVYGDVMRPSTIRESSDFGLTSLDKIRGKTKPGVGP